LRRHPMENPETQIPNLRIGKIDVQYIQHILEGLG
jgi:hypothetical protein